MLKNIGALKNAPRPSPQVVQAALNFLGVMGGKEEVKLLLEEMKGVQEHNSNIIDQAKLIIAEAEKRDAEVSAQEAALQERIRAADSNHTRRELQIAERERVSNDKLDSRSRALDDLASDLAAKEQALEKQRNSDNNILKEKYAALEAEKEALTKREDALRVRGEELDAREKALSEEEACLASMRDELDSIKSRLDARDARLRAAMGDEAYDG